MVYKERAKKWHERALQEKDEFIKFLLLFISFDVCTKLKFNSIRDIKQDNSIKDNFYIKIDEKYLMKLKQEIDKKPHENMNTHGDKRWSGKLNSTNDFDGIIEFIIRSRNNLFHGDKGLNEKRDLFIVKTGTRILQPLVETMIL